MGEWGCQRLEFRKGIKYQTAGKLIPACSRDFILIYFPIKSKKQEIGTCLFTSMSRCCFIEIKTSQNHRWRKFCTYLIIPQNTNSTYSAVLSGIKRRQIVSRTAGDRRQQNQEPRPVGFCTFVRVCLWGLHFQSCHMHAY